MRKFRNWVIGGIESKTALLILIAILLTAALFMAVSQSQNSMLSELAAETGRRQQDSMTDITASVIDTVIEENMGRITELEAMLTDDMFRDLEVRVRLMADYAQKLFDSPDEAARAPYAGPDAANDGVLTAQVLLAEDADPAALEDRLGLIANMSELMLSLCKANGTDNACVALPEGATLTVNTVSASWVREDGSAIPFDARARYWYRQAADAGKLVFTDIELDQATQDKCVTCAMPVYGADGALRAVISADLFLTQMQQTIAESVKDGGFMAVVNQSGHVILSPEEDGVFRVRSSAEAEDLRESDNAELAALIGDALREKTDVRMVKLENGVSYMVGVPMKSVGWALIASYGTELADQPVQMLQENYQLIQQEATAAYRGSSARSRRVITLLFLALLIVLLGGALYAGRRIVKPLNTITARIAALKEGDMEFKMEDAYRTGDEIEVLAQSFADISHKTVEYVEQVKKVTAEKERIGTELHMANQIQESMLPSIFPPYPDRCEFDLYASMDPAKEVGGDFYDFFLIDRDHLALIMADVSGKGVPAALFMMVSKALLKNTAMLGKSPSQILSTVNETICSNNKMQMFVTVWLGILEISTGVITAASAGHEYPAIRRSGEGFQLFKDPHGFVIGGMEGVRYREYTLSLQPGDKLFLYTDGVPEANNAAKELFGTDRMISVLSENAEAGPREVLQGVRHAVDAFVGDAE